MPAPPSTAIAALQVVCLGKHKQAVFINIKINFRPQVTYAFYSVQEYLFLYPEA